METISPKTSRAARIKELLPQFLPEGQSVEQVDKLVKLEAYKQMYRKNPELRPTKRFIEPFEDVVKRLGAETASKIASAIEQGMGYNMKTGRVYTRRTYKKAPAAPVVQQDQTVVASSDEAH